MGVEHEYAAQRDGAQVDFRGLLPVVAGDLGSLDPGDPRARRLPSGCALTADGQEAEIATPPLVVAAGTPDRLDSLLARERSQLARELAAYGVDGLRGFSTHVNVSCPDDLVVGVARTFVRSCALGAVIAAEPHTSAGLLVRPRRGRLEIGGEYAEGQDLLALTTYIASAVAALLPHSAADGGAGAATPDPPGAPEPVTVASREKFGWFLPPEGAYLALLTDGPTDQARGWFAAVWAWARPHGVALGLDPGPVDRLLDGPWRLASSAPADTCSILDGEAAATEVALDTGARRRPGDIVAQTTWLTWQHVVWGCYRGDQALHAVLPVEAEEAFLRHLDEGRYDALLDRELTRGRLAGRRRRLVVNAQLDGPGWWHEVRPGALVPAERGPDGRVPRVSYRRARRSLRAIP